MSAAAKAVSAQGLTTQHVSDCEEGEWRGAIEDKGLQLVVSSPPIAKGAILGGTNLATRTKRACTSQELSLLASIGQQISVAMDNARP
jgi:hypothetical protein